MKHTNAGPCPSCTEKLKEADPKLQEWFHTVVETHFPGGHVSWSFRGKESQDQAFEEGKSKLRFPKSPHNAMDSAGNPCARALDLFFLAEDGKAHFPLDWYKSICATAVDYDSIPIRWGGTFKTLGDYDHFELAP